MPRMEYRPDLYQESNFQQQASLKNLKSLKGAIIISGIVLSELINALNTMLVSTTILI